MTRRTALAAALLAACSPVAPGAAAPEPATVARPRASADHATPLARALRAAGVPASVAAMPFATTHGDVVRVHPASRFHVGMGREAHVDGRMVWFFFETPMPDIVDGVIGPDREPADDAPLRRLQVWGADADYADAERTWRRTAADVRAALTAPATCEQYVVRRDLDGTATRVRKLRAALEDTGTAPAVQLEIALVSALDTADTRARAGVNVVVEPLPDARDALFAAVLARDGTTIRCPGDAAAPPA